MKNKKTLIIIAAALVVCFGLTVCGVGGWLLYQKARGDAIATSKAKALIEISDNFSKAKTDFMFLQSYFTDNGLYSANLAKHQNDINVITTDINYNKSTMDFLSADSKAKLIEYYTKISTILLTKKNQNANADLYFSLFNDPNSKYNQGLNALAQLYKHKVESMADVADIISVYNSLILLKQEVLAQFLAIDIPIEQQAYKTFITDWINLAIKNVTDDRNIYQQYYDSGTLPPDAYTVLITTWNTYSANNSRINATYNAAKLQQQIDMQNMYNQIILLGNSITVQ